MPASARHCAVLAAALACALAGVAVAGPVTDKAAEIESMTAGGDYQGALAASRDLTVALWDEVPGIVFSETLAVAEPAAGFGLYNPRPDTRYKPDEPVILYAEPFGFGYGTAGEGLFTIGFFVDLQVLAEDGSELANVQNVTELNLASRYQNREFQANITYNLTGIQPGKYRLVTTLRDKNSPKSGSFETEIEVVAAEDEGG